MVDELLLSPVFPIGVEVLESGRKMLSDVNRAGESIAAVGESNVFRCLLSPFVVPTEAEEVEEDGAGEPAVGWLTLCSLLLL